MLLCLHGNALYANSEMAFSKFGFKILTRDLVGTFLFCLVTKKAETRRNKTSCHSGVRIIIPLLE